ncbi:hypothetical protein SUDANB132_00539 [Streptomyces sp. enrichment culture]
MADRGSSRTERGDGALWLSFGPAAHVYATHRPDCAPADSVVATLATRVGVLVMPDRPRNATLSGIRAYLGSRQGTSRGEFTLPLLTGVLRVRRTS